VVIELEERMTYRQQPDSEQYQKQT
jgi:hypothetical protein